MKKQEFLEKLRNQLWALSEVDQKSSLEYYAEMIDDRMEDGLSEEEAVAAVGDLDEIVKQIRQEMPQPPVSVKKEPVQQKQQAQQKQYRRVEPWMVVLLVLGSPVWIPLVASAAATIFSVYMGLWVVVVSLYAVTFALGISAVGLLMGAASLVWIRHFAKCAVTLGSALLCAGLAILLFMLSNLAAKLMVKLAGQIWNGIKHVFIRKERRV